MSMAFLCRKAARRMNSLPLLSTTALNSLVALPAQYRPCLQQEPHPTILQSHHYPPRMARQPQKQEMNTPKLQRMLPRRLNICSTLPLKPGLTLDSKPSLTLEAFLYLKAESAMSSWPKSVSTSTRQPQVGRLGHSILGPRKIWKSTFRLITRRRRRMPLHQEMS